METHAPGQPAGHAPSDGGLSSLGLIMQLVGGVMTAVVACYGMLFLFAMMLSGGRGGGPAGTMMLWLLIILGVSLARSVAHRSAGSRLLYEGPGTPLRALMRYTTLAFVQTAVVCGAILINGAPGGLLLAALVILAGWPVALLIVARPKLAELGDAVPMADDKGFEGASILLLVFGSIGLCVGAIMLLGWLDWPGQLKSQMIGIGLFVAFVMLAIRSGLHLRAGVRGVGAHHMAETAEAAVKYANFGVIAAVVIGGALFVGLMSSMPSRGGGGMLIVMLAMVGMITWALLVWPLTIRRFFSDRQFATMVDDNAPATQDSADRGLPALGWLLLGFGVYALGMGLAAVLMGDLGDARAMRRMSRDDNPLGMMMGLMGSAGGKSPWFGITVAALQIWAGVELIRLTPRYKVAGMVFGIAASAVAVYIYLPLIGGLMEGGAGLVRNPLASMAFASVAIALVVPVVTMIFVQRKPRDIKAIASTFE